MNERKPLTKYIECDKAIEALRSDPMGGLNYKRILTNIPAADVVPYSIEPDGTLTVTVPKGTKRIGRILIEEDGTQYGGLFYPDTGGCFLSSMERCERNG